MHFLNQQTLKMQFQLHKGLLIFSVLIPKFGNAALEVRQPWIGYLVLSFKCSVAYGQGVHPF